MADAARPSESNQSPGWMGTVASKRESIDKELNNLNKAVDDIAKRMKQVVTQRGGKKAPAINLSQAQAKFTQLVNKVHEEKRKVAQAIREIMDTGSVDSENVLSKHHILLYETINGIERKERELMKRASPLGLNAEVKTKAALRAFLKRTFTPEKGSRQEEIVRFKEASEEVVLSLLEGYTNGLSHVENKTGLQELLGVVLGSNMMKVSSDPFKKAITKGVHLKMLDDAKLEGHARAQEQKQGDQKSAPVKTGGGSKEEKGAEYEDLDSDMEQGEAEASQKPLEQLKANRVNVILLKDELINFIKGYPESVTRAMTTSPASEIIKKTWRELESIKAMLLEIFNSNSEELQELSDIELYEAMIMPFSHGKFLLTYEARGLLENLTMETGRDVNSELTKEIQPAKGKFSKMYSEDIMSHMYTHSQIATHIKKFERIIRKWLCNKDFFYENLKDPRNHIFKAAGAIKNEFPLAAKIVDELLEEFEKMKNEIEVEEVAHNRNDNKLFEFLLIPNKHLRRRISRDLIEVLEGCRTEVQGGASYSGAFYNAMKAKRSEF